MLLAQRSLLAMSSSYLLNIDEVGMIEPHEFAELLAAGFQVYSAPVDSWCF